MLSPRIFTRARDWPRLASAHHNGVGVPLKNFNYQNLKFALKFRVCALITSGIVGVPSRNFSRPRAAREGWYGEYNFWKARPLKFGRAKKRPNFGAISDNFRLWSRISPERIDIYRTSEKKLDQPQPLLRWGKEIWWILVHNQKRSRGAYTDPPKWTFCGRLHFGP